MAFAVQLAQFEGPLSLLLELIESEKLDISQVSLAKVTDAYLAHLENDKDIPTEELADFLVVATRLLLIKSRLLLPFLTMDEGGEENLEAQLRIYKEYLDASKLVEQMIGKRRFLYVHEKLPQVEVGFAPPKKLGTDQMAALFAGVIARLAPLVKIPQAVVEKTVSIHEKIRHIQSLFSGGGEPRITRLGRTLFGLSVGSAVVSGVSALMGLP